MHIDELLGHFEAVRWDRDGHLARCPSHDDGDPSLKIFIGDDRKVRMTCRASCKTSDVVAAAGLKWPDLFDVTGDVETVPAAPPGDADAGAISSLGGYAETLRSVLHYEPSDGTAHTYLSQRFGLSPEAAYDLGIGFALEGDGSFPCAGATFTRYPRITVPLRDFDGVVRGLQGRDISGDCPARWVSVTNPPGQAWQRWGYMRGAGGYDAVIVAEGPGDGLTAVALGYDAVVIRGAALAGSQAVLEALAQGLAGKQVVAAGDNDSAGLEFNRRLAEGLAPYGIAVTELRIPVHGPKTDITRWREADPESFAEGFHAAVRAAKPIGPMSPAPAPAPAPLTLTDSEISTETGRSVARIVAAARNTHGATDAMRAHALVNAFGGTIRWAKGLGFYVWNGRFWEPSAAKVRQASHVLAAALNMAGQGSEAAPFGNTRDIDHMLTELRSVPGVWINADDFDSAPHLLSFANGTVDLRDGSLRPHDKDDLITVMLRVDYVADATAPRWERFLAEIFPDSPGLVGYVQRLCGYGITGSVSEQCFAVLWGGGSNGKSVLTDTLTEVFTPMVTTTPFATFESKPSGGIPNDLAALRGARLVMASEGESGKPMSEAVLKRLTGKDAVTARFLNREFFTYKPTFLIMLATNHKPSFRGQDEGLWRRVKLLPFKRYFAPAERDYGLGDYLLEHESEGIAAWAVRGAQAWYAGGLADPEEITSATRDYRQTSDSLSGFFPGVLTAEPGAELLGADAFNDYLDWCEAENLPPKERWTRRAFYSAMDERGVFRRKGMHGVVLVGVRRTADTPVYEDDPEMFSEGG